MSRFKNIKGYRPVEYFFLLIGISFFVIFVYRFTYRNITLNSGISTICYVYKTKYYDGFLEQDYYFYFNDKKYYEHNRERYIERKPSSSHNRFYKVFLLPSNPDKNYMDYTQEIYPDSVAKYFSYGKNPFEQEIKGLFIFNKRETDEVSTLELLAKDKEAVWVKQCAMKTLFSWINNKTFYRPAEHVKFYGKTFLIDSIVAINKTGNRAILSVLYRYSDLPNAVSDAVSTLYGFKVNDQWYFFEKEIKTVLPREEYQREINTPLSFEKLHKIALEKVFAGYLEKKSDGSWIVNDKYFDVFDNLNKEYIKLRIGILSDLGAARRRDL